MRKKKATETKTRGRVTAAPGRKASVTGAFKNQGTAKNARQAAPARDCDRSVIALPLGNSGTGSSSKAGGVWLRMVPKTSPMAAVPRTA